MKVGNPEKNPNARAHLVDILFNLVRLSCFQQTRKPPCAGPWRPTRLWRGEHDVGSGPNQCLFEITWAVIFLSFTIASPYPFVSLCFCPYTTPRTTAVSGFASSATTWVASSTPWPPDAPNSDFCHYRMQQWREDSSTLAHVPECREYPCWLVLFLSCYESRLQKMQICKYKHSNTPPRHAFTRPCTRFHSWTQSHKHTTSCPSMLTR